MKKIILSVAMIAAVAAVAIGATTAYFSDVETSTGNTFTAGAIDLTVDNEQHYNNTICTLSQTHDGYSWQLAPNQVATVPQYPVIGSPCDGTWAATNLGAQKFFNFRDVKPGDSGEDTISIHVDNNDSWLRLVIKDVADLDNSCTEPEEESNDTCTVATPDTNPGDGELRENLLFSVFTDADCDNIQDTGDVTIISAGPIDLQGETWQLPSFLPGDTKVCFGVEWSLPSTVGNEVQTDSLGATMEFQVEQYRNNAVGFDSV